VKLYGFCLSIAYIPHPRHSYIESLPTLWYSSGYLFIMWHHLHIVEISANLVKNTYSFYTYRLYLFLLYKNTSVVSTTERLLCFLLHSLLFCPLLNVGGVILYCTAWPGRQFPCFLLFHHSYLTYTHKMQDNTV